MPLLAQQESFYRLLRRATSPDPGRRFASAADMAEQLTGVLREVLATGDGDPRPAFSALFSPELQAAGAGTAAADGDAAAATGALPPAAQVAAALPVPQVDTADPAAGYLATLSTLAPAAQIAALSAAVYGEAGTPQAVAESAETRLVLARAQIVSGALDGAAGTLAAGLRGSRRLADHLVSGAAGAGRGPARGGPGRFRARSTTRSPESSHPSWRWGSPPRPPATGPPPPVTSAASGRSTGPTSAPHSGSPGSGWRRMTGLARSRRWPRCRRRPFIRWRPRSWPSGFISPAPASRE